MNAIAAVSAAWGIGREGDLLFRISGDLKRFRALTSGGTVIMGRKTLDSLPGGRPLPKRRNIVLTRDSAFAREGVEAARSLEEVLSLTEGEDPETVWVCGGGEVYRMLLPFCPETQHQIDGPALDDGFRPAEGVLLPLFRGSLGRLGRHGSAVRCFRCHGSSL